MKTTQACVLEGPHKTSSTFAPKSIIPYLEEVVSIPPPNLEVIGRVEKHMCSCRFVSEKLAKFVARWADRRRFSAFLSLCSGHRLAQIAAKVTASKVGNC